MQLPDQESVKSEMTESKAQMFFQVEVLNEKTSLHQQMVSELEDKITLNSGSFIDSFENETSLKEVRSNKKSITSFTNGENVTANQVKKFNDYEEV